MGPAGSGKSTLVTQFAVALAAAGERIACYLFEETRENFLDRAAGLNLDLRTHIAEGRVTIDQIDPAEISPGEFAHRVRAADHPSRSGQRGDHGAGHVPTLQPGLSATTETAEHSAHHPAQPDTLGGAGPRGDHRVRKAQMRSVR